MKQLKEKTISQLNNYNQLLDNRLRGSLFSPKFKLL